MSTITAANSIFALSVASVFPAPQILQGYSADDAFTAEAVEAVEVLQGIDGVLSGGFVFNPFKMDITLQADSPSIDIFSQWDQFMRSIREVVIATGSIALPAIGKKFSLRRGFLTSFPPMPPVKKVLQPIKATITWEQIMGTVL